MILIGILKCMMLLFFCDCLKDIFKLDFFFFYNLVILVIDFIKMIFKRYIYVFNILLKCNILLLLWIDDLV